MKTRLWTAVGGFLGMALAVAVVMHEGYVGIWHVLRLAGWNLLWLIPLHLVPLCLDAEGWRTLLKPSDPDNQAQLPFLLWIATIREAVNRLLPVASVGGELVGIRLVLLRPLSGAAVTASVIVEVLLTIMSQYLLTALGLVLLVTLLHGNSVTSALFVGLAASLPVPIFLYWLLRHGAFFTRLERFLVSMLGGKSRLAALFCKSTNLDEEIRRLFAHPFRLGQALLWQFSGMLIGSFETWLALKFLGHPVSAWEAITLESLTLAIRHFVFFIPSGVGVQEAGLVVFGDIMGLPPDVCVALSLAKRLREIGFGILPLLSWHWIEGKRLRRLIALRSSDELAT